MSKKEKTIEEMIQELQDILDGISSEETDINTSIKEYAKAASLIEKCQQRLCTAKVQIDEIDQKMTQLGVDDEL
ncbi:exodeoxyribonuclease VII small subunit [Ruminococcaceae bacterium OttesenSCG-928-I18]|nr:exodeoxyribonuclease VII small subunit [Ruminococcaceae bacterium OttesenSCG-928-I18]